MNNHLIFLWRQHRGLTCFSVAVIVLLVALGTWQVARLFEKRAFIAHIEAQMAQEPDSIDSLLSEQTDLNALSYRKVQLTGTLLKEQYQKLQGKAFEGKSGYDLVVPLKLTDGSVVLCNMGWVPRKTDVLDDLADQQNLVGYVHLSDQRNVFSPKNTYLQKDIYTINPEEAAISLSLQSLLPFYVMVTGPRLNPDLTPHTFVLNIHNFHLTYAFTWFSLALIWILLLGLYGRKKHLRQR